MTLCDCNMYVTFNVSIYMKTVNVIELKMFACFPAPWFCNQNRKGDYNLTLLLSFELVLELRVNEPVTYVDALDNL